LNVDYREESPTRRVFAIELTPEEVGQELERVVADYTRRVQLPGFRKGKVPRTVLEARFGNSFEQETIERAIERACREAFTERSIAPLAPAEIEDLKFQPGGPLSFRATVEVRPEVTARDYTGLAVTRRIRAVTDEEVEREVDQLVEATTPWLEVDREARPGDLLVVDYVRLDARGQSLKNTRRRDYEIRLGGEGLLPEFDQALAGGRAGESRTVNVTYGEDFGNPELAGKTVQFHVRIRKIKEKKEAARDDNWAKETLGVDSLDELKARIRLNLEGEALVEARRGVEDALVEQVVASNPVPVPERWAERRVEEELAEIERRNGGPVPAAEADAVKAQIRAALERQLARELVLDAIARQESLAVTDPEVGEEMSRLLEAGGRIAQEFRALPVEQRRRRVRDVLERRKVFDFLLDRAQVSEENASNPSKQVVPA
jgi:trigger factor